MNRQKDLEKAARRINALKELTNKIKVSEKLAELEKESAWNRTDGQTTRCNFGDEPLISLLKLIKEKSIEIEELRENIKNKKAIDLIKIELKLNEVKDIIMDFSKTDENISHTVNSKMNQIIDLRMGLKRNVNWKKINELKQLENKLEDIKLIIIKIQIDEEAHWPFENVD